MGILHFLHSPYISFQTSMTFPLGWSWLSQNPLFNSQADPVFICAKRQILVRNWTLSQSPVQTPYHSGVRGGWMLTHIPLSQPLPRARVAACSAGGSEHRQTQSTHSNSLSLSKQAGWGHGQRTWKQGCGTRKTRSQGSDMQHWGIRDCSMKH